jgi:heat-inducible transcriptional repressor
MDKFTDTIPLISELDQRSREIFRRIVEGYLDSGEPIGSRSISKSLPMALSPASVRNVMSDLETLGLIYAPHTSAGRLPTERGLRFFVDALLEIGDLSDDERKQIETHVEGGATRSSVEMLLTEASHLLSGLSQGAGVVTTSKADPRLKHIEFVRIEPTRALVVLVADDGRVENRLIQLPEGLPASALVEASNYLNALIKGRRLADVRAEVQKAHEAQKAELDALSRRIVEEGLAVWGGEEREQTLIVRGRANLLSDPSAIADLERVRTLFDDLEQKQELMRLLSAAEQGEGVRIFIGSENKLFSLSGSSLIVAPYRNDEQKIVGVVGVIGPTRLNYARVIPMVDYTAKVIGSLLSRRLTG